MYHQTCDCCHAVTGAATLRRRSPEFTAIRETAASHGQIHPATIRQRLRPQFGAPQVRKVVVTARNGGLRQGELFALRWTDYDPATGALTVTKSLAQINGKLRVKAAKTANSRRLVVLDFARPVLDAHRAEMTTEGWDTRSGIVFCNEAGDYLRKSNFLRRTFSRLRTAAGVPKLKFHELRHSSATLMLLAGVDTKTVSSRLGHGSAGFTMNTYQHVIAGMQAKAAGALAGILTAAAVGYSQATVAGKNAPGPETKKPRKS